MNMEIDRLKPQTLPTLDGPDQGQAVQHAGAAAGTRVRSLGEDAPPPPPADHGGVSAASMGLPMPTLPAADLSVILLEVQHKTQQAQLNCSMEEVNNIKKEQAADAAQRMQQINQFFDKLEQSQHESIWQKIFGWIAAAFMMIAGAVLMAAGGSGAPLLAAGVAMAATMALQQTGALNSLIKDMAQGIAKTFGCSPQTAQIVATVLVGAAVAAVAIAGSAVGGPAVGAAIFSQFSSLLFTPDNLEAMGMKPEDAQKWSLGLTIGLMVTGLAAGIGGIVKSAASTASEVTSDLLEEGGLANTLSKAAGKAVDLLKSALPDAFVEAGEDAAETVSNYSKQIETAARVGAAASKIGGGAAGIASAVDQRDADRAEADAKDTAALMMKLQQMFDDDADRIKKVVQAMQETTSIVMDILSGVNASEQKILTV